MDGADPAVDGGDAVGEHRGSAEARCPGDTSELVDSGLGERGRPPPGGRRARSRRSGRWPRSEARTCSTWPGRTGSSAAQARATRTTAPSGRPARRRLHRSRRRCRSRNDRARCESSARWQTWAAPSVVDLDQMLVRTYSERHGEHRDVAPRRRRRGGHPPRLDRGRGARSPGPPLPRAPGRGPAVHRASLRPARGRRRPCCCRSRRAGAPRTAPTARSRLELEHRRRDPSG